MLLENRPDDFGLTFKSLGMNSKLLKIIKEQNFVTPTEIQQKAIPLILSGRDIIACSKTGSGKTASFVLPMIEKLKEHSKIIGTRALILVPTRELALQILDVIKIFSRGTGLRTSLVVGGYGYEGQFESLASNPDILIATPGRLSELLGDTNYALKKIEYLVFDEGDSLFEMGFEQQIIDILKFVSPKEKRQTLLFSATIPNELKDFAMAGLNNYRLLRIDSEYQIPDKAVLHFFLTRKIEKESLLVYLLQKIIKGKVIVFCPSKQFVEFLTSLLPKFNLRCVGIFGKQDQQLRREYLNSFREGRSKILVVTDLAARGLDIPDVLNVVNFCFPQMFKTFVHRCGRTARANRSGTIYSILSVTEERQFFGDIINKIPKKMICTKESEKWDPSSAYYGKVPEDTLLKVLEVVLDIIESDGELSALRQTAENSYKKFMRSRQKATHEGHVEVYDIDLSVIHPMFSTDQSQLDILKRVSDYKPTKSYMELKAEKEKITDKRLLTLVGSMKSQKAKIVANSKQKGSLGRKERIDAVKRAKDLKKRELKIKEASMASKKNKDKFKSKLFIKENKNEELFNKMLEEERIKKDDLDMVRLNNVSEQLFEQRKYMWDEKAKKYIKKKVDMKGKVISEREKVTVGEGVGQKFKRWKQRSQIGFQREGEEENSSLATKARHMLVERTQKRRITNKIKKRNEMSKFGGGGSQKNGGKMGKSRTKRAHNIKKKK